MEINPEDVAKRLRTCAESRGMSQTDVGRELGISMGTTSRYFSGGGLPKVQEMLKLARFFGVSIEWLLTGEMTKGEELRVAEEAVVYAVSRKKWMSEVLAELEAATEKLKERIEADEPPSRS